MEPVAVIGIGCRFPHAEGPEAFWRLLAGGGDAITEVPATRWDNARFYDPDPAAPGKTNSRWGGFLDRVDHFDADFFGIQPTEAAQMDPQQRLLLEIAWEAFEDAGLPAEGLAGSRTGVFVGLMFKEYAGRILHGDPTGIGAHTGTGNTFSIAANRISYFFDLKGPSLAVDSACSSSLVALHTACRSLAHGECDLALAGGVNVILDPGAAIYYTKAGMMARDGRCKAFDARADGFVRGEGGGAVVLKPLAQARADGDPIHAVVRGSAVNHDGRSNGLTAPNPRTQEAVMRAALDDARISPSQLAYLEAHGTGTSLGDAMEARALGAAIGEQRCDACVIGSVKTNVGHLEAAAGIASLIKAVLVLSKRAIPPSLHFEQPNPLIPFADLRLRVATRLEPLPAGDVAAVVGINAFGFGGTNAHVVLEAVAGNASGTSVAPSFFFLPLSAASPAALKARAATLRHHLAPGGDGANQALADVCATSAVRRSHLDVRLVLLAKNRDDILAGLAAFAQGQAHPTLILQRRRNPKRARKLAFLFPDTVDQPPAAVHPLLQEPAFRQQFERCDGLFHPLLGCSLVAALGAPTEAARPATAPLARAMTFAIETALAALWRSLGIRPAAVAGMGVGEIAAACIAEDLDLEHAAPLILHNRPAPPAAPGGLPRIALAAADSAAATTALVALGRFDYLELFPASLLGDEIAPLLAHRSEAENLIRLPAVRPSTALVPATLGALYVRGHTIDLAQLFPTPGGVLRLPAYPWQGGRHWVASARADGT